MNGWVLNLNRKEVAHFIKGVCHKIDGPAWFLVFDKSCSYQYWQQDRIYRQNGPAVTWRDGSKGCFYKDGKQIREKDFYSLSEKERVDTENFDGRMKV